MSSIVSSPFATPTPIASTPVSICQSIVHDLISGMFASVSFGTDVASDTTAPATTTVDEDVDGVCKSVLSRLISQVAEHTEQAARSEVLAWFKTHAKVGLPRPCRDEALPMLQKAFRLLTTPPSAKESVKRICADISADEAALTGLLRLACFPKAVDCLAVVVIHVREPSISKNVFNNPCILKQLLSMGSSSKDRWRRSAARVAISAMTSTLDPKDSQTLITADEFVPLVAHAFKDGFKYALNLFEYLDFAKQAQVRAARISLLARCAASLSAHYSSLIALIARAAQMYKQLQSISPDALKRVPDFSEAIFRARAWNDCLVLAVCEDPVVRADAFQRFTVMINKMGNKGSLYDQVFASADGLVDVLVFALRDAYNARTSNESWSKVGSTIEKLPTTTMIQVRALHLSVLTRTLCCSRQLATCPAVLPQAEGRFSRLAQ